MKTFNRRVQDVRIQTANQNQYFKQLEFHGIKNTTNIFEADQYSLEDSNNVYIDDDLSIVTRPPIRKKEYPEEIVGDTLVDKIELRDVIIYVSKRFINENIVYDIHAIKNNLESTIVGVSKYNISTFKQYIICWNNIEAKVLDITSGIFQWKPINEFAEIPVTKITVGNSVTELDQNQLSSFYIEQYIRTNEVHTVLPYSTNDETKVWFTANNNDLSLICDVASDNIGYFPEYTSYVPVNKVPGNFNKVLSKNNVVVLYFNNTGSMSNAGTTVMISYDYGQNFSILELPFSDSSFTISISEDAKALFVMSCISGEYYIYSYTFDNLIWTKYDTTLTHIVDDNTYIELATWLQFLSADNFVVSYQKVAYNSPVNITLKDIIVIACINGDLKSPCKCSEGHNFNESELPIYIIDYSMSTNYSNPLLNSICNLIVNENNYAITFMGTKNIDAGEVCVFSIYNGTFLINKTLNLSFAHITNWYYDITKVTIMNTVNYKIEIEGHYISKTEAEYPEEPLLLFNLYTVICEDNNEPLEKNTDHFLISFSMLSGFNILGTFHISKLLHNLYLISGAGDKIGYICIAGTGNNIDTKSTSYSINYPQEYGTGTPTGGISASIDKEIWYLFDNQRKVLYSNYLSPTSIITFNYKLTNNNIFKDVPSISYSGTELYLAFDNTLKITNNLQDGENFKFNLPKINNQTFTNEITNIINISLNEVAIFFKDSIIICSKTKLDKNNLQFVYLYHNTRLSLGVRLGDDVINTLDGANTLFPTIRGLAVMNYQNFVASTEQILTYLTDDIIDIWHKFYNDSTMIKLTQMRNYIFITNGSKDFIMLDLRNKLSWWKFNSPYPINKLLTNQLYLDFIADKLYTFDYNYDHSNYMDNNIINDVTYHYDEGATHLYLDNNEWKPYTWSGENVPHFNSENIWPLNGIIHLDEGATHLYLDNNEWKPYTWSGENVPNFYGKDIWPMDGVHHYDKDTTHLYLDNNEWKPYIWSGENVPEFDGGNVWPLNGVCHLDEYVTHLYLDDNEWKPYTWSGSSVPPFDGKDVWLYNGVHRVLGRYLDNNEWKTNNDYPPTYSQGRYIRLINGIIYRSHTLVGDPQTHLDCLDSNVWNQCTWSGTYHNINVEKIWTLKKPTISTSNYIDWHITSQKLHFFEPNNYKNIKQLVFQLTQSSPYKNTMNVEIKLYRKVIDYREPELIEFSVDEFRTFVKRFNYWKINELQYTLRNDKNTATPSSLIMNGISVKYEKGEEVR